MAPRRALLISYHFPPSTEAGAQRWGAFTRVGEERGWKFDVVTSELHTQPPVAEGVYRVATGRHWINRSTDILVRWKNRLRMFPSPVKTMGGGTIGRQVRRRAEISFPRSFGDLRRNVRALLRYTEALPWMSGAKRTAINLAKINSYDVIIASGPPHMSAEAARVAATLAGKSLVLDFRDPWSLGDIIQDEVASWVHLKLASRLEGRVVGAARLVVMNTPRAAQMMRRAYPTTDIIAVPNGFNGDRPTARHPHDKFIAMFTGEIYIDRDPRPVLSAIAQIAGELGLTAQNFEMRFIGPSLTFGGLMPEQLADAAGVPFGLVTSHPAIPRTVLFEKMEAAALLVNLPQGESNSVPSKVYEYLHFPAWVLGLEPAGTATHDVLAKAGADVRRPDDVLGIAEIIKGHIQDFRAGVRPVALAGIDEFRGSTEATRFFDAVEERLPPA